MPSFIKTIEKIDKFFLRLSIFSFFLLIVFQAWHFFSDKSIVLERRVGETSSYTAVFQPSLMLGTITLQIISPNNVNEFSILINKEIRKYFKDNMVQLVVRNGDLIELDQAQEINAIKIKVLDASSNIKTPKPDDIFTVLKQEKYQFNIELEGK